jgi:hypothetical protein
MGPGGGADVQEMTVIFPADRDRFRFAPLRVWAIMAA